MPAALIELIVWGKIVFSVMAFVGTAAIWFHDRYWNNRSLRFAAGLVGLAGVYSSYVTLFPDSLHQGVTVPPSVGRVTARNNSEQPNTKSIKPLPAQPSASIPEQSAPAIGNPVQEVPDSPPSRGDTVQRDSREADRESGKRFSETHSNSVDSSGTNTAPAERPDTQTPDMLTFSEKPTNYDLEGRPHD
jgi:hypothetical protein